MEVLIPSSFTLTLSAMVMVSGLIIGAIRAYFSLRTSINERFRHLEEMIDKMAQRNERADMETEKVKAEQAKQETTIAVMAEQMRGITVTLTRVDGNVSELIRRGMKDG